MDLNSLLADHQISLMRARDAEGSDRCRHREAATGHAVRIEALKAQLGATFPTLAAS